MCFRLPPRDLVPHRHHIPKVGKKRPAALSTPKTKANNLSKNGSTTKAKKRKLTWMSKALLMASVEVTFLDEGYEGGSDGRDFVFWIVVKVVLTVTRKEYQAVLDTRAMLSTVVKQLLASEHIQKTKTVTIRIGHDRTIHFLGSVNVEVYIGDHSLTQHRRVLKMVCKWTALRLSLARFFCAVTPRCYPCNNPMCYTAALAVASFQSFWSWHEKKSAVCGMPPGATKLRTISWHTAFLITMASLQISPHEIDVELFVGSEEHFMQPYCSFNLNNAFRFFCKYIGLGHANLPSSLLEKILTKIVYEGVRMILCIPDRGTYGEHTHWWRMLD